MVQIIHGGNIVLIFTGDDIFKASNFSSVSPNLVHHARNVLEERMRNRDFEIRTRELALREREVSILDAREQREREAPAHGPQDVRGGRGGRGRGRYHNFRPGHAT